MALVRRHASDDLSSKEVSILRELFEGAWADDSEVFTDEDWEHALGGFHFILEDYGEIVAHASVVQRELHTAGHRLATGYVEAVATSPGRQRQGHGSALMKAVDDYIDGTFQLGALDTGRPAFYRRLGWLLWKGPTLVRTDSGVIRTPEEDGSVLVRLTPTTPELDLSAPISCDWRPGDVW
ncbi:MAG TPA: GNAT family N-acetyltransferase [Actinomycetota bacterium]|nr:GNAT family N-acetyltransferase [Actinomycetota bacterium]